ncbi:MAG: hypothetical protein ACLQD8_01345 [Thermoplasmata archaeon]
MVGITLAVGSIVLVGALATIPLPRPFTAQVVTGPGGTGSTNITFLRGGAVTGVWWTHSGASIQFAISPSGSSIYFPPAAPNGHFAFTADGSAYTFAVGGSDVGGETVHISGNVSYPVL